MHSESKNRHYDLEDRTYQFANDIINFTKRLKKSIHNIELIKQLVRSASSVGANYIEANESLGKKDFLMKIKICRKESKESGYWLKLIDVEKSSFDEEKQNLIKESIELMKIFGSILQKSK